MPLPPTPPRREPMSDAEKALRDRIRRRMYDRLAIWDERPDDFDVLHYQHGRREPFGAYTKQRMFDGRFWSMEYRWVKARGRYELMRSTVRHHARRKDAKERAWLLHRERSAR